MAIHRIQNLSSDLRTAWRRRALWALRGRITTLCGKGHGNSAVQGAMRSGLAPACPARSFIFDARPF